MTIKCKYCGSRAGEEWCGTLWTARGNTGTRIAKRITEKVISDRNTL
ncbi:MAG: Transposase [Candidatus Midichloria mitochondrii]|nr:hypothetical protein [Candidatus Midichloria mitochondrii]MDJ1256401.1 hypothetical protein [Candidatus Midichloria mitochondrii]MDJ1298945.1 hypothetical protein [Candidatus Midichloria mitochondrii]MDJ1313171.1 hypothetical protein [Candidatus Midichloria mitochondrii]